MSKNKRNESSVEEVVPFSADEKEEILTGVGEEEVVDLSGNVDKKTISSTEEEVVDAQSDSNGEKTLAQKLHLFVYDAVATCASAMIIIALIFTFACRLVSVKGESMTNTLQHNDWLLTTAKSEYEQGDIVVITQDTYFHEPLIKRVIAKGGQTIDIDYATATVYVDGEALEEKYVKESFIYEKYDDCEFPYTVPDGYLFCMGDNRNGSTDSRSSLVGPIDERAILGKAVIRVVPFGDFDIYDYE